MLEHIYDFPIIVIDTDRAYRQISGAWKTRHDIQIDRTKCKENALCYLIL